MDSAPNLNSNVLQNLAEFGKRNVTKIPLDENEERFLGGLFAAMDGRAAGYLQAVQDMKQQVARQITEMRLAKKEGSNNDA